jgi:hypothetical protein
MKCQEAQQLIYEYLDQPLGDQPLDDRPLGDASSLDSSVFSPPLADQQLAPAQFESLTRHFSQCAHCGEKLQQARQLRQRLKDLNMHFPVPAPTAGFVDRALRTAVSQHDEAQQHSLRHSHRQGFIKGFSSALVAGLALWMVVSFLPGEYTSLTHPPSSSTSDAIIVSLQEPTNVKLAFHSLKDVPDATIKITLSKNLELVGYQNRQTLEWKTDLVAGDNILTLPIKALKLHQGKIIAQVGHNNLYKSIELTLDVKNNTNKPGISENKNIDTPVA